MCTPCPERAFLLRKYNASPSIFCGLTIEGLAFPSLPGGKEFPFLLMNFYVSYHGSNEKSTHNLKTAGSLQRR